MKLVVRKVMKRTKILLQRRMMEDLLLMIREKRNQMPKPVKKEAKKDAASKLSSSKRKSKDGDEDSSKKRKPKKKKDPNAPKRAMSGFMFFLQAERENLKRNNPGMSFTDVGRALGEKKDVPSAQGSRHFGVWGRVDVRSLTPTFAERLFPCSNPRPPGRNGATLPLRQVRPPRALGERWKKMTAEEKEPYESMAWADQKRYKEPMAGYKCGPTNVDSGNESDSE